MYTLGKWWITSYIYYVLRKSVVNIMKNRRLIQMTKLDKIIHPLKNVWIGRKNIQFVERGNL